MEERDEGKLGRRGGMGKLIVPFNGKEEERKSMK